jgi:hypothetical protein
VLVNVRARLRVYVCMLHEENEASEDMFTFARDTEGG